MHLFNVNKQKSMIILSAVVCIKHTDGIFTTIIMYRNSEYFEHLFNVLIRYKLRKEKKKLSC